ncbi:MAG TPA: YitT family protein [Bacillota bacterium]|nr:YitT family protein [Bacillota bacterium]
MLKREQLRMVLRIAYIIIGSFIYAAPINALLQSHNLLSGGVTGIAMILNYMVNIPTGLTLIVLNIPLFFIGYRYVSRRFTYFSILGITSASIFLIVTEGWVIPVESPLVAAIFGGLISGIGSGIVIRNRGSMGGTDILSVLLYKYLSLNIGGTAMAFNAVILTLAAFLFNVEMAMLTLVGIFIANKAVDAIQDGFNHRKTIIIVSDKYEEISAELLQKVKRGITHLDGHGAYTGNEKRLIYMVVRTMELAKIKDIVRKADPQAFLSIIDTREVEGQGFSLGDLF